MKNITKNISTLAIAIVLMAGVSACFDERDEGYEIVGPVATIPVLTVSKSNVVGGEQITVNVRYYSERVAVTELRLAETVGTGGTPTVVQTKAISGFDIKNSYLDSFVYTVPAIPAGPRVVITLTLEVKTSNDLLNSRTVNINVN